MKRFILLVTLIFSIYSCQDLKKEKQLKAVKALKEQTKTIENNTKKINFTELSDMKKNVMEVEFRIRRNYYTDTINKNFAKKINDYKMIRKRLKPAMKIIGQLKKGCEQEKKSLNNLSNDIKNAAGERHKYDDYIKFETNKVKQLQDMYNDVDSIISLQKSIYKANHEELNAFSFELLKKNK